MHKLIALVVLCFFLPGLQAEDRPLTKRDMSSLEISVVRKKSTKTEDGDYDDKTEKLRFLLEFRNRRGQLDFNGMKVVFYLFGISQEDRKSLKLMQRDEKTISIPALEEFQYETPEVVTMWDNTGGVFGEKYKGWVLLIYGKSGDLLFEKSSSAFIKNLDRLPSLNVDSFYDKNLDPTTVKSFLTR